MKLMLVPSLGITDYDRPKSAQWLLWAKCVLTGRMAEARAVFHLEHSAEVQIYADLPLVNGRESTFIVGNYHPGYTADFIPSDTHFPSQHRLPKGTHLTAREALASVGEMDVVLVGLRSGQVGEDIRQAALRKGKFVVIIDHFDHPELVADPKNVSPTYTLQPGQDFHLYMKISLALGVANDVVRPLGLLPIRVQNFPDKVLDFDDRHISVFFRGALKAKKRGDRWQFTSLFAERWPDAVMEDRFGGGDDTLASYWDRLAHTKIGLSPVGKIWDAARHSEVGVFGCVPLMPRRETEISLGSVQDGVNCLIYDIEYTDGGVRVRNPDEVLERVRSVVENRAEWERLSAAWRREVFANHTTERRARYILEEISARL